MSDNKELLARIRKLNWLLSESTKGYVSFDELCRVLAEMMEANVYVVSMRGKVLASVLEAGGSSVIEEKDDRAVVPRKINDRLMRLSKPLVNASYEDIVKLYGEKYEDDEKYHLIEPVVSCGDRIATMLVARPDRKFSDEDIVICELGATIVGMEVAKGLHEEEQENTRGRIAVSMAIVKLSYSELAAVKDVFAELEGDEALLVASKVADKYGITRSVIVNALRKLESAGVIESRSLGRKGTRIKILNQYLREELDSYEV
ncbi:MAG: GTP-sensing pleiotropic transcriptional regulator CodY [Eubacterium sp.]|nr:GTP-sensing pleiotropic transcriptional regulator CodY [Eubacterium sp.]